MNGSAPTAIRVLIIDDDRGARRIVREVLKGDSELEIVGEAVDGEHGLELARESRPAVIITDLDMPIMGGLDMMTLIGMQHPRIVIVIFSSLTDDAVIQDGFARGARAYVPKSSPGKLREAVRLAATGGFYFGS
jgi:two-component system, chemotaxis family, protein-glutamate methylesterase/glutaminase